MTTYKKEVERTEQLGIEYQTALDNIITEIKKDDNISLDRILDIVDCIQYIKSVRKRWAAGTGNIPKFDNKAIVWDRNKVDCISIPNLSFKPTIIIMTGSLNLYRYQKNAILININHSSLDNMFGCFCITTAIELVDYFSTNGGGKSSITDMSTQWTTEKWIAIE